MLPRTNLRNTLQSQMNSVAKDMYLIIYLSF